MPRGSGYSGTKGARARNREEIRIGFIPRSAPESPPLIVGTMALIVRNEKVAKVLSEQLGMYILEGYEDVLFPRSELEPVEDE